uniref:Prolyl endopeptidase n=1 Tax=Hordeum vulgare subsp. vulgare TaxID=112509 RepID=A0A8I6YGP8_HORVV
MLPRRYPLPALLRLFSTTCRRRSRLPPQPHPPNTDTLPPLPAAKKVPFTVSAHGRSWSDPYHWMRDTSDPDLAALLAAENAYAEAFVGAAGGGGLRARLAAEMRARLPPSAVSPPQPWGPWSYYQYVPNGMEYPVLSRKLRPSGGLAGRFLSYLSDWEKEEVLLDWNMIAEKFGYVHIGSCRISPDHRFLAYTLDTSGGELFSLEVKDLQSKHVIFSSPDKGIVSLAWTDDSENLFYTVCDETLRPNQVFCKKMQSDEPGLLVFMEDDVNCCVDITSTKDFKYITVYVMESGNVREGLWPVQKRTNKVQYFLEHHNGFFYILTNAPLKDTGTTVEGYYLARRRAEKSLMDKWQVVALPGSDCTFQDMDIFHEHLVLFLQKDGLPLFCSIDLPVQIDFQEPKELGDFAPWFFPIPSSLCSILPGPNNDFMSSTFRMVVSSPVIPDLTVDYDMRKKTFTIVDQEEVTGLCSSLYTVGQSNVSSIQQNLQFIEDSQSWSDLSKLLSCERVQVVSHDGVSIPLVILYSREAHIHGESPGILYGYGAYGEDLDKSWCSDRLSLLARGWVLAFADVRGGGDPSWHLAGTKTNKINSIQDFAACGMHLIKEGLVHESRLCAMGCSAGGLLVGAVVNMLPNLFSAAVLKVPFLDICNTMLDPTLPLTILDYEEFGDPNIPVEFDAIRRYSPYDNLSPGKCYPSILVTASFNDTRVGVWEAAKWVSKVRDVTCPSCSNSVVLKTNMQSGHFGEGGRLMGCEETAFDYAFLMKALGMDDIASK